MSYPSGTVEVSIAGTPAEILFAGMAPGLAGILQLNLRTPAGLEPGELAVDVRIGGVTANPTTLWVAR